MGEMEYVVEASFDGSLSCGCLLLCERGDTLTVALPFAAALCAGEAQVCSAL